MEQERKDNILDSVSFDIAQKKLEVDELEVSELEVEDINKRKESRRELAKKLETDQAFRENYMKSNIKKPNTETISETEQKLIDKLLHGDFPTQEELPLEETENKEEKTENKEKNKEKNKEEEKEEEFIGKIPIKKKIEPIKKADKKTCLIINNVENLTINFYL